MVYDAVSIEYAFARLIGNDIGARGTSHDADAFRGGDPADISVAISDAADALEERVSALSFSEPATQPGSAAARIKVAIGGLRSVADSMSRMQRIEREDYRWLIVGSLISVIAALLDELG